MKDIREISFIIILASAFLIVLLYVLFLGKPLKSNIFKVFGVKNQIEVVLLGDVMLGRSVMTKSIKEQDFSYPFKKVEKTLSEADLVFANLEAPFVKGCSKSDSGMKLCADPGMAKGLSDAGMDVLSLANNHISDYGDKGLKDTEQVLSDNNIAYTGLGSLVIKEVGGVNFGFLGFDFVSKKLTQADLDLVADSDKKVDVLIVGVHWGTEYKAKASNSQRLTAKSLVEAGADVIVGHHPHWVQDIEYINPTSLKLRWARPVYYSLGNLVFDQPWSEETKKGLVIKLTFKDGELLREEKLPIYISSLGQPEFVK